MSKVCPVMSDAAGEARKNDGEEANTVTSGSKGKRASISWGNEDHRQQDERHTAACSRAAFFKRGLPCQAFSLG